MATAKSEQGMLQRLPDEILLAIGQRLLELPSSCLQKTPTEWGGEICDDRHMSVELRASEISMRAIPIHLWTGPVPDQNEILEKKKAEHCKLGGEAFMDLLRLSTTCRKLRDVFFWGELQKATMWIRDDNNRDRISGEMRMIKRVFADEPEERGLVPFQLLGWADHHVFSDGEGLRRRNGRLVDEGPSRVLPLRLAMQQIQNLSLAVNEIRWIFCSRDSNNVAASFATLRNLTFHCDQFEQSIGWPDMFIYGNGMLVGGNMGYPSDSLVRKTWVARFEKTALPPTTKLHVVRRHAPWLARFPFEKYSRTHESHYCTWTAMDAINEEHIQPAKKKPIIQLEHN